MLSLGMSESSDHLGSVRHVLVNCSQGGGGDHSPLSVISFRPSLHNQGQGNKSLDANPIVDFLANGRSRVESDCSSSRPDVSWPLT